MTGGSGDKRFTRELHLLLRSCGLAMWPHRKQSSLCWESWVLAATSELMTFFLFGSMGLGPMVLGVVARNSQLKARPLEAEALPGAIKERVGFASSHPGSPPPFLFTLSRLSCL